MGLFSPPSSEFALQARDIFTAFMYPNMACMNIPLSTGITEIRR